MISKRLESAYDLFSNGLLNKLDKQISGLRIIIKFFVSDKRIKSIYYFLKGVVFYNYGKHSKSIVFLKSALFFAENNCRLRLEIILFLIKNLSELDTKKHFSLVEREIDKIIKGIDLNFYKKNYFFYLYLILIELKERFNLIFEETNNFDFILSEQKSMDSLSYNFYFKKYEKITITIEILIQGNYYQRLYYLKTLFRLKEFDTIIEYFISLSHNDLSNDILFIIAASVYKKGLFTQTEQIINLLHKRSRFRHHELTINKAKISLSKNNLFRSIKILKSCKNDISYKKFLFSVNYHKLGLFYEAEEQYLSMDKDDRLYKKNLFNLAILYYDINNINGYNKCVRELVDIEDSEIYINKLNENFAISNTEENISSGFERNLKGVYFILFLFITVIFVFALIYIYFNGFFDSFST